MQVPGRSGKSCGGSGESQPDVQDPEAGAAGGDGREADRAENQRGGVVRGHGQHVGPVQAAAPPQHVPADQPQVGVAVAVPCRHQHQGTQRLDFLHSGTVLYHYGLSDVSVDIVVVGFLTRSWSTGGELVF